MPDIERTGLAQAEFDRWVADAQLVEEESTRLVIQNKAFLAAEEALTDWDEYLHSLPIEAHQAALDGLREYQKHLADDSFVQGRERLLD